MHPAEGTLVEVRGKLEATWTRTLSSRQKCSSCRRHHPHLRQGDGLKCVAATVGDDEHSVGNARDHRHKARRHREYGIECDYLGTSVRSTSCWTRPSNTRRRVLLAYHQHGDIHRQNMEKINDLAVEKAWR